MQEEYRKEALEKLFDENAEITESEILELLLYFLSPRIDEKELAGKLLGELGDLRQCFEAKRQILSAIDGIDRKAVAYLTVLGEIYRRINKEEKNLPVIFNYENSKKIAIEGFRNFVCEKFLVLFLNKDGTIISREVFDSEAVDFVNVDLNKLLRCIPSKHPYFVVLFHNHLSGDCRPSEADNIMTVRIIIALKLQDITLWDHIIVSGEKTYSYRINGDLDRMEKDVEELLDNL